MPSELQLYSASRQFSIAANVWPLDNAGQFYIKSKSRADVGYWMMHTPEGFAVHVGEGCEAEQFRGVLGCWHSTQFQIEPSKEKEIMTETAVAVVNHSLVPSRIEFTDEQITTIANVICIAGDERAPAPFVQLFLAACRHTGLDPFLRQIYAMKLKGKWTIFVGVDGHRVVCYRTGLDNGMVGPEWSDDGKEWFDYPMVKKPAFCRVGIKRKGTPDIFMATLRMDSRENSQADSWQKDPSGMLAKCCEVLARRRAFPADMAVVDEYLSEDVLEGLPPEATEGVYREMPEGLPARLAAEDAIAAAEDARDGDPNPVKPLNLDADREAPREHRPDPTKQSPARKASQRAKAAPEAPVTQDEPSGDIQAEYDKAFREQLEAKAVDMATKAEEANWARERALIAEKEAEVVARPEPPKGEPQRVSGAPETKAQEMSKFWATAKKFEKDTGKIIAVSKEHFGAAPVDLEGTRRAQLITLLETGLLPDSIHEPVPYYNADGEMFCEACQQALDEETGKHI